MHQVRFAEIPCTRRHWWCEAHEEEFCENSKTKGVKHLDCKVRPLERNPALKGGGSNEVGV